MLHTPVDPVNRFFLYFSCRMPIKYIAVHYGSVLGPLSLSSLVPVSVSKTGENDPKMAKNDPKIAKSERLS